MPCMYKNTLLCSKLRFPRREEHPGSSILCPLHHMAATTLVWAQALPYSRNVQKLQAAAPAQVKIISCCCRAGPTGSALQAAPHPWQQVLEMSVKASASVPELEQALHWDNLTSGWEGLRMLPFWSWISPNAAPRSKALSGMIESPEACKAQLLLTMQQSPP